MWMKPVSPQQGLYGKEKVYFNIWSELDKNSEFLADNIIDSKYAREIMDSHDYSLNMDWKVVAIKKDNEHEDGFFELALTPKEILKNNEIELFKKSSYKIDITSKDIDFDESNGEFIILNKTLGDLRIPLDDFYKFIEKPTPNLKITNSFGDEVLSVLNGSFLNAGLAQIQVFSNSKDKNSHSLLNPKSKGGVFIREDGRLDFGDIDRTKYMSLNLSNLARELYKQKFEYKELTATELVKTLHTKEIGFNSKKMDKNHFTFTYFSELKVGDTFKFSKVIEDDIPFLFYTVYYKDKKITKINSTYGKTLLKFEFSDLFQREVMLYHNRKK